MKVLHLITRMILGGAQENTLLTCQGLHRRGHEVVLATGPALGPEGQLLDQARAGGYPVVVLDDLRREIHPRDWRAYRAIRQVLIDRKPDILHTHSSKAGILGRRAAWDLRRRGILPGLKIVHTVHGLPFHRYANPLANWLYIHLERWSAVRTDKIISVADAMTAQALAAGVGRPEQYTTIYSGMATDDYLRVPPGVTKFRRSLGVGAEDVLVTQVSRLAELKGHDYILEAAGRIADKRVRFCFVGDGRRRRQIERNIRVSGLEDRVHLTGLVPPDRIGLILHASDILVHCSLREGLARALPQAMLAGLPVISFDIDGAREVVDSTTGVLLEPGDVGGLTVAIQTLANSPDTRKRMGETGRARARRMFDHEVMVDKIERAYRELTVKCQMTK